MIEHKARLYRTLYGGKARTMDAVDAAVRDTLRNITRQEGMIACRNCGVQHKPISHTLCEECFWQMWLEDMEARLLSSKTDEEAKRIHEEIERVRQRLLREYNV